MIPHPKFHRAFTLIELLVVIAIIAVLMGLLIPAGNSAINAAKQAQAKNDIVGICNAVRAYNTEYGRFPNLGTTSGDTTVASSNRDLIRILTGQDTEKNPRRIVFMEVPAGKVVGTSTIVGGSDSSDNFFDPWGTQYQVRYDSDYDNEVANWYGSNAGPSSLRTQVIARSAGKDREFGSGDKKVGVAADDVISWQ